MALLVFDLDGTLVDPLPAIRHCLASVLPDFSVGVPVDNAITPHIGPGIQGLFADLFPDETRRSEALAAYWHCFRDEGIAMHRIYDGIPTLLARLKHQGHRLLVVTAKPTTCARAVLHHHDLFLAFDGIHGSEAGGPWRPKTELMAELRAEGALEGKGVLVGDRAEDVRAAQAQGLLPVGVTYGYGSREELASAGATVMLESVSALDEWLFELSSAPEALDAFSLSE